VSDIAAEGVGPGRPRIIGPSLAWSGHDFLTTKSGDSFKYSCAYVNSDTFAVTAGNTAAKMCMAIGYYFPAGSALCN
jgi:hypothetical protein